MTNYVNFLIITNVIFRFFTGAKRLDGRFFILYRDVSVVFLRHRQDINRKYNNRVLIESKGMEWKASLTHRTGENAKKRSKLQAPVVSGEVRTKHGSPLGLETRPRNRRSPDRLS